MTSVFALPSPLEWLAICAMVAMTYSTRLIGWIFLRNRRLSPRVQKMLEASPACVMAAIVAPAFMTTNPVTLVTLFATVAVARRFGLATTVVFSVACYALLNAFVSHLSHIL